MSLLQAWLESKRWFIKEYLKTLESTNPINMKSLLIRVGCSFQVKSSKVYVFTKKNMFFLEGFVIKDMLYLSTINLNNDNKNKKKCEGSFPSLTCYRITIVWTKIQNQWDFFQSFFAF